MKRVTFFHLVKELLPLAYLRKYQTWRIGWVQWFLLLASLPLLGGQVIGFFELPYRATAFFYSVYFATIWAVLLYYIVQPSNKTLHDTLFIASAGSVMGLALAYAFQAIALMQALYGMALSNDPWLRLLGFIAGVGVLEECSKALPLLIGVFVLKKTASPYDVIFAGIVCGLAFGAAESLSYLLGIAESFKDGNVSGFASAQFARLISVPLLHALWTGLAAFFIALAYENRWCAKRLLLFGLLLPILLHGCYDFFVGTWFSLFIALGSILLFILYLKNAPVIRLRLMELRNEQNTNTNRPK